MKQAFLEFHNNNPSVYANFIKFANQAIASGKKTLSVNFIFERLRWEITIEKKEIFKLNNNYRAFYVRMFEEDHPHYVGVFRKRTSEADLP